MDKFLIIQTAFTGDVILATIIIEKLHADFPGAQIDFLLRKGNEELFEVHPYLKNVLVWNKKNKKYKNLFLLIKKIRNTGYTKVINVQRYFSTGLATAFSKAKEKIGFDKNPLSFLFDVRVKHVVGTKENPVHETQRNLMLIKHFTSDVIVSVKLYPGIRNYIKVAEIRNRIYANNDYADEYICIAPSSVWFTKQFPNEKWIEFIKSLNRQKPVCLIGSAKDKSHCEEIKAALPEHLIINLCGELGFLQSAALMQGAAMNYANDSAPTHMASAMNAPITTIFCSTVTWFGFTPLSSVNFVVEKKEKLYCRPCTLHGKKACPEKHFKCANDISTRQLIDVLQKQTMQTEFSKQIV